MRRAGAEQAITSPPPSPQDVFAKDMRLGDASKVGVLLCGQKGMAEAVKGLLAEAGVEEGAILTNF
jgi:NAD(P)H-flavin reductase